MLARWLALLQLPRYTVFPDNTVFPSTLLVHGVWVCEQSTRGPSRDSPQPDRYDPVQKKELGRFAWKNRLLSDLWATSTFS